MKASKWEARVRFYVAGHPTREITIDQALDELLRAVVERDPDMYAAIGPNNEVEPGPDVSPLSLARVRTSGAIVKGKTTKSSKQAKKDLELAQLTLDEPVDDDEEDEG